MKHIISLSLLAAASLSQAQIFNSGTGLNWAITDDATTADVFSINAGALAGTLTQVDFFLSPAHTFIGDLVIDMTAPSGQVVSLLFIPGNAAPNSGASDRRMVSMFFADAGVDSDMLGNQAANGDVDSATSGIIYRRTQDPVAGAVAMSAVSNVAGTYTFAVQDTFAGDTGTIDRVQIRTTGAPVPEPMTVFALGLGATAMIRRRKK